MWKGFFISLLFCILSMPALAAGKYMPKQFSNTSTGEGLYPYSLNNRRQNITTPSNNVSGIGVATPMQSNGKRNVVKRPSPARAATVSTQTKSYDSRNVVPRSGIMRSATNNNTVARSASVGTNNANYRGVVARSATPYNTARASNTRLKVNRSSSTSSTTYSSPKCFANYKECMESYCLRENTAYNRCFCSAKLAQIDSKYQKTIDDLIQQIIVLQNTTVTENPDDEPLTSVEKYWEDTIFQYTGTNPWFNINSSIQDVYDNLNWADNETRIRGQNAFNIGHEYCVNYLRACSYMASNLRDAYKSEIARDCATYESTLQKIQTTAESIIENYGK